MAQRPFEKRPIPPLRYETEPGTKLFFDPLDQRPRRESPFPFRVMRETFNSQHIEGDEVAFQENIEERRAEVAEVVRLLLDEQLLIPDGEFNEEKAKEEIRTSFMSAGKGKYDEALEERKTAMRPMGITDERYQQILEGIIDIYLLTMPLSDPDNFDAIAGAERRLNIKAMQKLPQEALLGKNRGHLVRARQRMWVPLLHSPNKFTYMPTSGLSEQSKEYQDNSNWMENEGPLDHTLTAAELVRQLIIRFQKYIRTELAGQKLTKAQEDLLQLDANTTAIRMMFHDFGRVITHDRIDHELETQWVLKQAGVRPEFRVEPTIIHFFTSELLTSVYNPNGEAPNPENFLFHLGDYFGKSTVGDSTLIRRPANVLETTSRQDAHYLKKGNSLLDKRNMVLGYYGVFEERFMNSLLHWVEDVDRGLGIPREVFMSAFDYVENVVMPDHRARLNISEKRYGRAIKKPATAEVPVVLPAVAAETPTLPLVVEAPRMDAAATTETAVPNIHALLSEPTESAAPTAQSYEDTSSASAAAGA